MKEYVLDANAVLRFLRIGGGKGGDRVEELFRQCKSGRASLAMSSVNLGEVFYVLLRYLDAPTASQHIESLLSAVSTYDADATRSLRAAEVKHRYRLGYADSFAAALSLERRATLVSADATFERCGKALRWLRLPPYQS